MVVFAGGRGRGWAGHAWIPAGSVPRGDKSWSERTNLGVPHACPRKTALKSKVIFRTYLSRSLQGVHTVAKI